MLARPQGQHCRAARLENGGWGGRGNRAKQIFSHRVTPTKSCKSVTNVAFRLASLEKWLICAKAQLRYIGIGFDDFDSGYPCHLSNWIWFRVVGYCRLIGSRIYARVTGHTFPPLRSALGLHVSPACHATGVRC